MRKVNKVFISGKFNVIHPGHIRLFRLGKDLANKLVVGLDIEGLTQEEIDWRFKALETMEMVDGVHTFVKDNSDLIISIEPEIVLKGSEFRNRENPELSLLENFGGKLIFGSGINFYSESEFIGNELTESKKSIQLPIAFMQRNKIELDVMSKFLEKTKNLKVCVLGDLIVDEYITCHPLGMSQEEPTIVVKAVDKKKFLGGAGIVAAHCSALGSQTHFISVIGNDESSTWATDKVQEYGIEANLIYDPTRPTTLKQRYRSGSQTLFKLTEVSQEIITPDLQDQIYKKIESIIKEVDLLIFSDFSYGNLPFELVEKVIALALENEVLIAADSQSSSQVGNLFKFAKATLVTPTEREARVELRDQSSGLVILLDNLREYLKAENVLLKLGSDGILIRGENKDKKVLPTEQVESMNKQPIDTSGAGDSVLAASALALACGFDIYESALIGSFIAGIQVSRLGNIPISNTEIERYFIN
jgi:rfaE bifunctional protein kinase chain/domain